MMNDGRIKIKWINEFLDSKFVTLKKPVMGFDELKNYNNEKMI